MCGAYIAPHFQKNHLTVKIYTDDIYKYRFY